MGNAKQILEQVYQQSFLFSKSKLFYIPFDLTDTSKLIIEIDSLIHEKQFKEAINRSYSLIENAINAMNYYQKYDRLFLISVIVFGFLGWFSLLSLRILNDVNLSYSSFNSKITIDNNNEKIISISRIIFFAIFILFSTKFVIEKAPLLYFAYLLFPCVFWSEIFHNFRKNF